ncbi:hypothetical protein ABZ590_14735 [Streptomyces hirsutus]|uniref:hypothetical protein n=1 Tax=Streptomyces hirsutus TaxID=35620 RepID=UPI0033F907EB
MAAEYDTGKNVSEWKEVETGEGGPRLLPTEPGQVLQPLQQFIAGAHAVPDDLGDGVGVGVPAR